MLERGNCNLFHDAFADNEVVESPSDILGLRIEAVRVVRVGSFLVRIQITVCVLKMRL